MEGKQLPNAKQKPLLDIFTGLANGATLFQLAYTRHLHKEFYYPMMEFVSQHEGRVAPHMPAEVRLVCETAAT